MKREVQPARLRHVYATPIGILASLVIAAALAGFMASAGVIVRSIARHFTRPEPPAECRGLDTNLVDAIQDKVSNNELISMENVAYHFGTHAVECAAAVLMHTDHATRHVRADGQVWFTGSRAGASGGGRSQ